MTKAEQSRLTAWRLRVLQQAADDGNVVRVCQRFGISRKSFYKWKRRRAEHGVIGLCDRARTPHCSPRATAREVVSKNSATALSVACRRPGVNLRARTVYSFLSQTQTFVTLASCK